MKQVTLPNAPKLKTYLVTYTSKHTYKVKAMNEDHAKDIVDTLGWQLEPIEETTDTIAIEEKGK